MSDIDVDALPAEALEAAIARLEQERARRAENKPEAAMTTERVFVADLVVPPPAPPRAEPRPRKAKKPREAPVATPTPFFITMAKPLNGDAGRIEEGHFVQDGDKICLCDAAGTPAGEWRRVEGPGALYTARTMLRAKLAAGRGTGAAVDHSPIRYAPTGWR